VNEPTPFTRNVESAEGWLDQFKGEKMIPIDAFRHVVDIMGKMDHEIRLLRRDWKRVEMEKHGM
jgi:hypothetical protein